MDLPGVGCRQNRGLKRCLHCGSWFVTERAHSRFCTLCRAESRVLSALPWRPHREQNNEEECAHDAAVAIEAAD